jgi:hypothetical protein
VLALSFMLSLLLLPLPTSADIVISLGAGDIAPGLSYSRRGYSSAIAL